MYMNYDIIPSASLMYRDKGTDYLRNKSFCHLLFSFLSQKVSLYVIDAADFE